MDNCLLMLSQPKKWAASGVQMQQPLDRAGLDEARSVPHLPQARAMYVWLNCCSAMLAVAAQTAYARILLCCFPAAVAGHDGASLEVSAVLLGERVTPGYSQLPAC